ncbi:MAG TPA: tetratricopeptide repeat protein [Vicinamibacteria bacterium]|jgi:tetratricopeptide (TPR) repeat protein|nr:tetratricopeptide repeat protein [Vicinamibacteria bacterium]
MKRILEACGLLLCFALLGTPARAQTGSARGRVANDQGQPIVEAKVEIEFTGGLTRKYETKTNKKGEFIQVGMPPGTYKVTVNKEGYQGSFIELKINLGDPTQVPDFKLKALSAAQSQAQKAASGGGQDDVGASFKKAVELARAGQYDEAEAAYKELLAKDPSIPEVQYNLGLLYRRKKDVPAAEAAFLKAIELRPGYPAAYLELSNTYQNSGQLAKAVELMTKIAADNPGDAKLQFGLGEAAFNSGKYDEAGAAFQKAGQLDPSLPEVYYYLGTLAVTQNKVAEAVANLEKYLSMNPQNEQFVATAKGLLGALKPSKK